MLVLCNDQCDSFPEILQSLDRTENLWKGSSSPFMLAPTSSCYQTCCCYTMVYIVFDLCSVSVYICSHLRCQYHYCSKKLKYYGEKMFVCQYFWMFIFQYLKPSLFLFTILFTIHKCHLFHLPPSVFLLKLYSAITL